MRLKEIKPGMAIHCKTEAEAKELLGYLHEKGCRWSNGQSLAVITEWECYREETCYSIDDDKMISYANAAFYKSRPEKYKYIRYTDLILPELTAREGREYMERLTYVTEDGEVLFHPEDLPEDVGMTITQLAKDGRYKALEEIAERLANREQAEEQGLLLRLPCKAGDTVYSIHTLMSGVKRIVEVCDMSEFFLILAVAEGRFGKTVFLTKEEAEQALKQMGE